MMKYLNILFAVALSLVGINAHSVDEKTFVWDSKTLSNAHDNKRAMLNNQAMLEWIFTPDSNISQHIAVVDFDGKRKEVLIENDIATIAAAFPNFRQANAVLLTDTCSGIVCYNSSVSLVVPYGNYVKKFPIGKATHINLVISDGVVIKGTATGIPDGDDEYGTPRTESYDFVKDAGFVNPKINRAYLQLFGQHPDRFFSHEVLRKPVVSAMGAEAFRQLRYSMGVSGGPAILKGRYLLFQGCVPHNCEGNYAALLIDAISNDSWWTKISLEKSESGRVLSSKKVNKQQIAELRSLIFDQSNFDEYELIISDASELNFRRLAKAN